MVSAGEYRLALVGEVELIQQMLGHATAEDLAGESPCAGWSVLDVARHVEITPRSVAANLVAHLQGEKAQRNTPLAPTVGLRDVLASLEAGARSLDEALSQLSDETLDGELPGPVGAMPGRAALDLAQTELTLHRCDIALGLGYAGDIEPRTAERIIDVIRAWLLLVAPTSPVPDSPLCYLLSDGAHEWTFHFDGTRWISEPCDGNLRTITAEGACGQLALALAGRVPIDTAVDRSSDPAEIAKLKIYLPGP